MHIENFHLALLVLVVGLLVGVLLEGPAAVDVVAVQHAITTEPVEILVEDGLAQLLQLFRVALRLLREQGWSMIRATVLIAAAR